MRSLRLRAVWLLVVPFLWFARPTPGLLLVGLFLGLFGVFVRAWAAGTIHKEKDLTTTGPYAFTRNPLYVGSFFLGLGITLAGGQWIWPAVFLAFYVGVYGRTMAGERELLTALFGDRYLAYAANVPAVWPRLTPWHETEEPGGGFTWAQYKRNREWEAALGALLGFGFLAGKFFLLGMGAGGADATATYASAVAGAPVVGSASAVGTALVDPRWEVQFEDSTALIIGMSVVDTNTVWVAGQPGLFGRTTDGGVNWTVAKVPGAETQAFRDVQAFSADEALVLSIGNGDASRIYRTTDGGATWSLLFRNPDPNAFFDCFSFWDRQRGFAFSDSHDGEFTIIRTEDGGVTWTRVDPADVPDARPSEGAFAASGTCTAAGPDGLGWFVTGASQVDTRVMRTTDYGHTWSEAPTPVASASPSEGLASIAFRDARNGVVFGSAEGEGATNVATTSDGGVTWAPASPALGGIVYGGAVVPGAPTPTLVVVSPRGSAYSTDNGASWTDFDTFNYWTVAFLGADVGWAGGRGRISRMVNGGR